MKRRVGIIGSICEKLDGQTIKTKTLLDELRKRTDWNFYIVNTQNKNTNPFRLLLQTFIAIITCKDIFILVSRNGARVYFPLLFIATKLFKVRVYHDMIGGSPEEYVQINPRNRIYLNSFIVNWVESKQMVDSLAEVGVTNAEVLPNFKRLKIVENEEYKNNWSMETGFNFCTFSRVMKEKGIEDAISVVEKLNSKYGRKILTLDIYGSIEDRYVERFNSVMEKCTDAVKYKGLVPYDKSVDVVKNYYSLLFPTYWSGEGFPGTIVDAFSSGVPVIASDWNANKEIIQDGFTGIVYPNQYADSLEKAVEWSIVNRENFIKMRHNCIYVAKEYQPDKYITRIVDVVEKGKI